MIEMNKSVGTMWDKKFSGSEYMYTKSPNVFLKEHLDSLDKKSKILFLGEGEGRNAVYAARAFHEVYSVDASAVGIEKTEKLASEFNVVVKTLCADLEEHTLEGSYEYVMSSYMHLEEPLRTKAFKDAMKVLQSGGKFIGEFFSQSQIDRNSGGPKSLDLLYSVESLKEIFSEYSIIELDEKVIKLSEGKHHSGDASVIRVVIQKP